MKKLFAMVCMLMLTVGLLAGCGGDQGPKKMVIGLDDNFAPMGFRDKDNKIVGFDIDLAREACKRLKMDVEFKPIDWSAKEAELNGKRIDAIWNCLTILPERQKAIDFSKPYMHNKQILVVPADSKVDLKADLAGKVLGVQDDSTGSGIIDKDDKIRTSLKEYRKYPDFAAAFLDMDNKRIDVLLVDEVLARYYMQKTPGKYRVCKDDMGAEIVGVGFRKGDKDFKDRIDKVLDEMKKDGTMKKISMQWFGDDVTMYDEKK